MPFEVVPGHHVGGRRARLRRHPRHPPGPVHLVHRRHRPRATTGPTTDIDWEALARAGGTIVVLMGVAHRAEIAAAPDRRRPRRRHAGGRRPVGHPPRPAHRAHHAGRPRRRSPLEPPVDHRHRRRSPASTWPGSSAGPLFGRRVVVTRAREPGVGAGRSGSGARRRGGRGAHHRDRRPRRRRGRARRGRGRACRLRLGRVHVGQRGRPVLRLLPRRPGPRRRPGRRHRAGHGRRPGRRGVVADLVPSASWPRPCSRPSPPRRRAAVLLPRAAGGAATCWPTACGPGLGRSTSSRPTAPCRSRRRRARWPRRPRPTPSPSRRRRRSTNYLEPPAPAACRPSWPASARSPRPTAAASAASTSTVDGRSHTDGLVDALVAALARLRRRPCRSADRWTAP